MKPYYELSEEIGHIVLELIKKCQDLNLGNVNFQYPATKDYPNDVNFYITEYNTFWELAVKQYKQHEGVFCNFTDVYKIIDSQIIYEISEEDLV